MEQESLQTSFLDQPSYIVVHKWICIIYIVFDKKRLHRHFLALILLSYQDRHCNGKQLLNNDDETIILNQITMATHVRAFAI